ncbi:hypothetical protein [Chitinivibrio alkaliphilus]|uniref:hypothetical protein n=1 Tax=Chitinivibrio alkaliphilus TaxID=1505232 RepID=UPI0004063FFC|nr:hypothetical protein [Chitinivibrio alkaliphilus]
MDRIERLRKMKLHAAQIQRKQSLQMQYGKKQKGARRGLSEEGARAIAQALSSLMKEK